MKDRQVNSTARPMPFLMVLASDHITGATGLVNGVSMGVSISKNALTSYTSPIGLVAELGFGNYALGGNATDRNTLGAFCIHVTGVGCDPTDEYFDIVGYDPYNSQNLGLAVLPATGTISSSDPWLTDIIAGGYTGNQAGNILGSQQKIPITGTVSASTSTSITITITGGIQPPTSNNLLGRGCLFITGNLASAYPLITGSTAASGGSITLSFGAGALSIVPSIGDNVEII